MPTPRERFRQAAADFAESFYDLLRADLLAGAAPLAAASPPAPASSPTAAPAAGSRADTLAAWLRAHGAATPTELRTGLGWGNSSLFDVIKQALARDLIAKRVEGRSVRYVVADAETRTPTAAPAAPPPETRQHVFDHLVQHGASTVADLVNGVGSDEAVVRAVLSEAGTAGQVQASGRGRSEKFMLVLPGFDGEVAGAELPADPTPVRARPKRDVSPLEGLVNDVAAFVAAHPNCRYGEIRSGVTASEGRLDAALKEARARGLIRLEGVKIKSRYFPGTPAVSRSDEADEVSAVVPVETPRAPASRPPSIAPPRVAPTYDARDASPPEVVEVLNELELALAEDMHDIRLTAVLQAIVADVRALQARFPEGHPARRRLDGTIRRITAIRAERDLGFINGLKRDAHANWHLVARDARKRIAAFDADAEVGAPKVRTPKAPKAKAPAVPRDENEQPLPNLIALNAERPVILVGGIKKNEVLEQVRAHHGLEVEWAAMQGTNARAADHLYERIKHGRVGAVVILEGLTGTTQIKAIVEACKAVGLPFAYGGRGGTESLRSALTELETRAPGAA